MSRLFLISSMLLLSLQVVASGEKLRDPTRPEDFARPVPGVVGETKVLLPRLSSVLIGGDRRLAVIDGHVMSEGDVSNGVRVERINSDRVVVTLGNSASVTLMLDTFAIHKEVR